ncbi:MAG: hypothetical protein IJM82_00745 [Synergistaceae bacterium]|nr:hypothetical protein [Synergistaceae bacterium]MBQ6435186.1 hypothetical protein [Synergistaceae bacterium]MBQ7067673.1 hypothetical protein [Synergistaceae bacterium]MBR0075654.1 hypothetical protein [Synergistaceae bacterium]MBR0234580.1 hypothetical protein [Synergistaceae bacterium]
MGIIDEKLLTDVFGIAGATVQQTEHITPKSIVNKIEEAMPIKENEAQELIKKSPEPFLYRQGEYRNFKEALRASGFNMFVVDIFGYGEEDNYECKEAKIIDYLRKLYIKMYGDGEMEYQKQELVKALKEIDRLREYIP